ncbi:MAG: hypothetical protein Q7R47_01410, partial [Candidatus Diapherotrites archaeon]|nr:hypothetical protein [Candidatus Diapherotrites archaeon]
MPIRRTHPTPAHLAEFWRAYDAGGRRGVRRENRFLDRSYGREPVAVKYGVLGTVRNFVSVAGLNRHLELVTKMNEIAKTQKFQHFELIPTRILAIDTEKNRTLEEAHRGPNIESVLRHSSPEFNSLYGRV